MKCESCALLIGKPLEELMSVSLQNILHELAHSKSVIHQIKNKSGEVKSFLWEKIDLFDQNTYLLGSDVSQLTQLQEDLVLSKNRLESLLVNSGDIVFVINTDFIITEIFDKHHSKLANPKDTYLNKSLKVLGMDLEDNQKVIDALDEIKDSMKVAVVEYHAKRGDMEKWFDLKLSTILDSNHKTKEFICVLSDITSQKMENIKKLDAATKRSLHHEKLFELSIQSTESFTSFNDYLKHVTKIVSETLNVDRVSIWQFSTTQIECLNCYQHSLDVHTSGSILQRADFPSYFKAIETGLILKADDALQHESTKDFTETYFNPLQIKSLMDIPIRLDGELACILCCEHTYNIRYWSEDDANFAKNISDIISVELAFDLRKQAEKELDRVKKILNESNRIAQLGGWEYSADTELIMWSDITKEILQLESSYTPRHPICLDLMLHETDRKSLEALYSECLMSNKSFDKEVEIRTGKGISRWIRIIAQPERRDGKIIRIYGAYQNIDEQVNSRKALKESEQKFQQITNTIKDVFWLYDITEHKVLYISPSCKILFGHEEDEFYKDSKLWMTYTHPEDIEKVKNAHALLFTQEFFELEYRIIINNETRWIYEKSFGIKDHNGAITKNSGINIDITTQKNLNEKIQQNLLLEGENKAKASFLANMSHEIRTPLNGVIGISDLLGKTKLDSIQEEYVKTVNESALLLHGIINNILDYSKIDSGQFELISETHNLRKLCNNIYSIMSFTAKEKNIDFTLHISPHVPPCINIDDIRLKQVLINLLSNAIKFTEKGSVQFSISKYDQMGTSNIRFSVADTGIGIREENRVKIFEAFTQEDSSTTKKYGGTGLGLAISSKLLALMGSKINMESEVGKGSHFYFDLKMSLFSEDPSQCEVLEEPEDHKVHTSVGNLESRNIAEEEIKILLVEDNKVNMFLLKSILNDLIPGTTFYEAVNGLDAVKICERMRPDIIFMDIQMPIMNGMDATREIRKQKNNADLPIIAVTAGTSEAERNECMQAGMNEFLRKPIVRESIEKTITQFLNIQRTPSESIDQSTSEHSHINLKQLEEANIQNGVYLKSIFPYIKESMQECMEELQEHYRNKDIQNINLVAHRLKGTALTASFSQLTFLSRELEMTKEFDTAKVENLLTQIESEIKYLSGLL